MRLCLYPVQLYGNRLEPGQGRQMPIHYGSKELNYQTVSSPLATQLPHAAGAAYGMKVGGGCTGESTCWVWTACAGSRAWKAPVLLWGCSGR